MATADDYAAWLVKNEALKGTADFETVAAAYKAAKASEQKPASPFQTTNGNLASQLGLTLRAGARAAAGLGGLVVDPMSAIGNLALDATMGEGNGVRLPTTRYAIDQLLNKAGVPSPQTPTENIISEGATGMAGAALGTGLANLGAKAIPPAFDALRQGVSKMAADPLMQTVIGGGAGLSGEQAKQSGAGVFGQIASSLLGGLAAGGGLSAGRGLIDKVRGMFVEVPMGEIDKKINVVFQQNGIDPATITPGMRAGLREQIATAMRTGDVKDENVARLADYLRLGLTPTRRRLTLDPVDTTHEMNAEKLSANLGTAQETSLPMISQRNNQALLKLLEDLKPISNDAAVGSAARSPFLSTDASFKAKTSGLYDLANGMYGGEVPLARGPVMNAIFDALNKENKLHYVPEGVMKTINSISTNENAPFNVRTIDMLNTDLATAIRSTQDGNAKRALGIIQEQLNSTPLQPIKRDFGGSQLLTQQQAEAAQQYDKAAAAIKEALDAARASHRARMKWQESSPVIENALSPDLNVDQFVKTNIISPSMGSAQVAKAAVEINKSPAALDAVRGGIMQFLKEAAIGKGNETQTGNFSGRNFAAALDSIGDTKLKLFFSPQEVEQLKAMGRVGAIETFQARGSAVNNSNTASTGAALVADVMSKIKPVTDKIPLGLGNLVEPVPSAASVWLLGRPYRNIPAGLLSDGETFAERAGMFGPLATQGLLGSASLLGR